ILVNLMGLRAWLSFPKKTPALIWISIGAFPYIFGIVHLHIHDEIQKEQQLIAKNDPYRALLVQTAFPAEEAIIFNDKASYISFVIDEWTQIYKILHNYCEKTVDLIALPEYVVPFGTYTFLYPHENVKNSIIKIFGKSAEEKLPPLEEPFAHSYQTKQGDVWFVNNAFWAQTIANIFHSEVIVGLEDVDVDQNQNNKRKHYSAAIHFMPNATKEKFVFQRYAKRVLLPMAEYIPFSFFESIASLYGIQSSLTFGSEATVFSKNTMPFGVSICYEETFGNLMRECRLNGAELFVNLTSDVWYPNSNLPKQHFDHARLRSVENGIPIVRACNTGITSACDSLGRIVAMLGDNTPESQWIADALYVEVPKYHYRTLYSKFGDLPILLLCTLGLFGGFVWPKQ
nr:apolipoprotein N-acyltransferase [Parachlamydiaceae bacterium]